jgi:integrating conjugative element relaxase (TIGR03760 family)
MIKRWFSRNKMDERQPSGYFRKMQAKELLAPYAKELQDIKELTGLPEEHFNFYYLKTLEKYVEAIQLSPASESHHHSHVGGMLQHSIEVLVNALRLRRGQILPPGITPEEIEQKKDIWTYTVFLCALLHDIGKIITDQKMVSHSSDKGWNLLSSWSMPGLYQSEFNIGRKHKFHEKLPAFVMHKFVSADIYDWLMSDQDVFATIVNFMTGDMESAGVVGDIVQKADQASVVANLGGDMAQAVKSPAQRPLSERLLRALQTLHQEGALPINRKGGVCFTTEDAAYFVSKVILDRLKERLRQDGQSVPDRNDRLMDELQQFEVIEPNGDKAIWKCRITVGDWQTNLSMLKFPIAKVWPSLDSRPERSPDLKVEPIDADGNSLPTAVVETTTVEEKPAKSSEKSPPQPDAKPSTPKVDVVAKSEIKEEPVPTGLIPDDDLDEISDLIKAPGLIEDQDNLSGFNDSLDEYGDDYGDIDTPEIDDDGMPEDSDQAAESVDEEESERKKIVGEIAEQAKKAITGAVAMHNDQVNSAAEIPLEFNDPDSDGARFVKWLVKGIRSGSIEVNQPHNRVHVVPEGLFLVSPAVFRMFNAETGGDWARAQRELTRSKVSLKTSKGENIFKYEIYSKSGRSNAKVIKGILIPHFETKLGITLTEYNEWMRQVP